MQFCKSHWDELRAAVKNKGLWPFVSGSGEDLVERLKKELGNELTIPDPLMTAHNMILGRALEAGGLYLMSKPPDAEHYCPLCELNKHAKQPPPGGGVPSTWWINGSTDKILADFKKQGWLKDN